MEPSRKSLLIWVVIGLGLGAGVAGVAQLFTREGGNGAAATAVGVASTLGSTAATPVTSIAAPTGSTVPAMTSSVVTAPTTTTTVTSLPPPLFLEAICREAWGAAPLAFEPPRHTVERLTVHHTAVAFDSNADAPARARAYQRYHLDSGWADLAYHFLIDAHGHVYYGRPVEYRGDTFTSYDPAGHFLVVLDGHFDEQTVPEAQSGALVDLLAWAATEYDVGLDTIAGHRDYAATSCPGEDLYARLGEVRSLAEARLAAGGVELVTVCGEEGRQLVASIAAGTDVVREFQPAGG